MNEISNTRNSSLNNNQSPSIFNTFTPSIAPSVTPSITPSITNNNQPLIIDNINQTVSNATNSISNAINDTTNTITSAISPNQNNNPMNSISFTPDTNTTIPETIKSIGNAIVDTTNSAINYTKDTIDSLNPFKKEEPTFLESIGNTFAPKTTPPISVSPEPVTPPVDIVYKIFRIVLMIILVGILALNAVLFLNERTDIFTKYLGIPILTTTSTVKGTVNTANKGGKLVLDIIKDSINDLFSLPELAIKQFINSSETKNKVESSNNNKKYCYIGKENNKRVCVEMNDSDTCESNKIFPTMDVCINPNLK